MRKTEKSHPAPSDQQWVHLNGKLVPKAEAHLSIYDHGFLYGDGAFEGIRVYDGNIFRLEPHLTRLFRSVRALGIELCVEKPVLQQQIAELVRKNGHYSGYIRLSVSRGVGLGLDPAHIGKTPTLVISTEQLRLYPQEMYENGLHVITASTRVPPSVCIDPQIKSLGRYVNNIMAKMEANRMGAGEALMLNMQGYVAEATGDNIFLVSGGMLLTPPTTDGALPGITRQAVMDLARDMGIACRETSLTLYDVYNADEAFLTGTAAEVIPMVSCDQRKIGEGKPGRITQRIIAAFRELTKVDGLKV
ncbi:MAG TPA: branched-chain-amino-acid transaminase [Chthonomonas sp.]|uniref:branched-chain-amino-acid transaminase n=1 Tax=Chthonomonas sp. TaxID=2282153 RepID=UPI002B4B2BDD|nr:branched-chain-amino-acid transaminase [Chthonomonas sp.]HLH80122.1 branched-chain-amino-acid transaminase [Chthonomonas sp.]